MYIIMNKLKREKQQQITIKSNRMNKNLCRVQSKASTQHFHRQNSSTKVRQQTLKKNENEVNSTHKSMNNKQIIQYNDLSTKQSSRISNTSLLEYSYDLSQMSFQKEQLMAQDFLKQDLLLQRKINKKQIIFRNSGFNHQFQQFITDQIYKFTLQPINNNFLLMLQQLKMSNVQMFNYEEVKNVTHHTKFVNFKQVMESLIFQRKYWFFIYTFDLLVCHLTFVVVLLAYWLKHQRETQAQKKNEGFLNGQIDLKHNITSISKAYIRSHPQQINQSQPLFLLILFFIDTLKQSSSCTQRDSLSHLQGELANNIKILRKIQKKQRNCFQSSQQNTIQSKIYKYQQCNHFISKPQISYQMIQSHIFQNFCSQVFYKFYHVDHVDPEIRKNYQLRKDAFCLWILQSIIKEDQTKTGVVHSNAAIYIVQIMSMLNKLKLQNNIEGISYLLPIVANIKLLLPKVWKQVKKIRPQIQSKLNHYTDFLLKNKFHIQQLGHNGIIWKQTIFSITQKLIQYRQTNHGINLNQHQKFYDYFLSQVFYYRHRALEIVKEKQLQTNFDFQNNNGFNLTVLENYLVKKYLKLGFMQCWKQLAKKAQKINQNISESVFSDNLDYWFVGSAQKYKKIDI